ncbi:MAG TPA: hypothetical protein VME47_08130 [Acetobacteraceae bacterium]|nr:hypothetical protein [Acetobacteraceae bacterium]
MILKVFSIIPAIVLALGSATALAQPAAHPFAQFDQAGLIEQGAPLRPYDQATAAAGNAAYVSDGSDRSYLRDQQQSMDEPGYSIGTGAARFSGT